MVTMRHSLVNVHYPLSLKLGQVKRFKIQNINKLTLLQEYFREEQGLNYKQDSYSCIITEMSYTSNSEFKIQ